MWEMRLYMAQRLSAVVMAPLVIGHLGVMIYAVQGGLTADEILSRTQGSMGWALFYGLFVVAASVHAAIGLRTIASEWLGVRGLSLTAFTASAGLGLLWMGLLAVASVTTGTGGS